MAIIEVWRYSSFTTCESTQGETRIAEGGSTSRSEPGISARDTAG